MIDCLDCPIAETNPRSGRYTHGCPECTARSLANSPAFWDSARSETLTGAYRSALRLFFSADVQAGHLMVKAWAARLAETTQC